MVWVFGEIMLISVQTQRPLLLVLSQTKARGEAVGESLPSLWTGLIMRKRVNIS